MCKPFSRCLKISINATAAGFICKNIFPTPAQLKKIRKNKIGDIQQIRMFVNKFSAVLTNFHSPFHGEHGGSVVECRTPEREVRGSRPTAAVLCP